MSKITQHVAEDFWHMSQAEQASLLAKLQRYVERGTWAAAVLEQIAQKAAALPDEAQRPQKPPKSP